MQIFPTRFRTWQFMLTLGFMLFFDYAHAQQSIGIGTTSPASSAILDVSSIDQGVLFPRMSTAQKESIGSPEEGLMVYDETLGKLQIYSDAEWKTLGGLWELHPNGGIYTLTFVGIGDAPDNDTPLSVWTNTQHTGGEFVNLSNIGVTTTALYAASINNSSDDKRGGYFSAAGADGRKTGAQVWASGDAGENIGIYSYVEGLAPVNRAAWFGTGDVVVDEQMLVGSSAITDEPHGSALLELNSTSRGLLLPRMTATQRTGISSPAEGLLVYDTDSSKVFLRKSATWQSLGSGGGGGGSSLWNEDASGINYFDGNVGIGTTSEDSVGLSVISNHYIGFKSITSYSGSSIKTAIHANASSQGTGDRFGVVALSFSPSSGSGSTTFGVASLADQGSYDGDVYAIYGEAIGSGAGDRWAGFFNGNVRSLGQMVVGNLAPGSPDPSALLDLQSLNKGLLLPRMTSDQRTAIGTPAEGLLVYDTDSSEVFLRKSSTWSALGSGGGSGSSQWLDDDSPVGIYYLDGKVAIGDQTNPFSKFYVDSDGERFAQWNISDYTGGAAKYGLYSLANTSGTGTRYGVFGEGQANTGDPSPAYGVYGYGVQFTSDAPVYGVYGTVGGSGSGARWAGYFDGNTKVEDKFYVGDATSNTIFLQGKESSTQGSAVKMYNLLAQETIELDADFGSLRGGYIAVRDSNQNDRIRMYATEQAGDGASVYLYNSNGDRTIELDADFAGDGRIITNELEITGGSDLAEYFTASKDRGVIQAGSVVVIDPDNPGQVMLSTDANDKRVVGIVSGANGIKSGMLMGQKESIAFGDVPVAIAGRVYVKVDESGGTIQPGDFLTTSDVLGHAGKVTDWDISRGAILGKALTPVDEKGFVLVLVYLQ